MLARIEGLHVEPDDHPIRVREKRARAGREILQARADGEDDIRLGRERIGSTRAGNADRTEVQRLIDGQRRFPGLRFR